ncbi:hemolysin III family protein [uncultured Ferrovibrio sp.]|jgi:hemolysin III|uniref:PAQR family membrane homeostasis protein TrhA n=1 Tax=uncultured Ferrovibrio sp. TaxID=1576913 RepID=UPI002638D3DD|nr:hemolysin III family protein [uncultured Ferrovibrio sp.]
MTTKAIRTCSRAEYIADAIVHLVGLAFGIGACTTLAVLVILDPDLPRMVSLGLYAMGLMAMLGCSALYNMCSHDTWKALFRRFDHAAIFVMIAGSYTPFSLIVIGGQWGTVLLAVVWTIAVIGVVLKLFWPWRFERLSLFAYLLMGWTILVAFGPLIEGASPAGLALLVIGGLLYTAGVIFHLWERLPYQNAIWHIFVLAAAICHFSAILVDVAIG